MQSFAALCTMKRQIYLNAFLLAVFVVCVVCVAMWNSDPCQLLAACLDTDPLRHFPNNSECIGAYYQTSLRHVRATRLVLAMFRRAYALAPLFIYPEFNDLDAVEIDWNDFHPIIWLPGNASVRSAVPKGMHFATVDACVAYVNRIKHAARAVDWLLLLEDDVWVCNRLNVADLGYDMNGQCIALFDTRVWRPHVIPGHCYGGCGGFVLRSSFLLAMPVDFEYIGKVLAILERPIASDELLSALLLRANGTIGFIPDYAEKMTSSPVIVHQMKQFYDVYTACPVQ